MQLKIQKSYHWAIKRQILKLKIKRPTIKEAARSAIECYNLLKFCRDIIVAHQTGTFGGKGALWKFMKDVASNLNKKKQDYRFSHTRRKHSF